MNILRKVPVSLDYVLGIVMILAGIYMFKTYVELALEYYSDIDLFLDTSPYISLLVGGLIMILLPGKNMRRTIWLSGLILGSNILLTGVTQISLYYYIDGISLYSLFQFSSGIANAGCGLAMIINSLFFAFRKTKSIYVIIISLILGFTVKYFTTEFNYEPLIGGWDFFKQFMKIQFPGYMLYLLFALLFTSDEVSWYTRRGGMYRALNRLRTTNSVFAIRTLSRDQLILLMQCDHDYTAVLSQEKYHCYLDVIHDGGTKTLVFRRAGEDSMAGAFYFDIQAIVPAGTISDCKYVEIFGTDGRYMRMNIVENLAKRSRLVRLQRCCTHIPSLYFSLPNESLYDLVDGVGRYDLHTLDPRFKGYSIEITQSGSTRVARICREGDTVSVMNVLAAVPYCQYGAYTRLYLYGEMGKFMVFKVST